MATILIVDDARSTLRALKVILKREGYTVFTAASGTEGLTHIEQHEVDLLLCDVKMPKMDGLDGTTPSESRGCGHCRCDDVWSWRYFHCRVGHEGGRLRLPRQAIWRR